MRAAATKDSDKTEPRFPDDEGGDGEIDADFILNDDKPLCTWTNDKDEWRRVFVFDRMADSDIVGSTLVENMHAVEQWLKSGRVSRKPKLETVKE